MTPEVRTSSPIAGCLLGTAVADAVGLPYEGLSRRRAERMLGPPDRHRLLFGRGMCSDDTEHTCMVAQALIACGGHVSEFERDFAWRLRWWVLGLPAGVGMATLRAAIRLWLGGTPRTSGVHSAGNGPAMRAAVIGATFDDPEHIARCVRASTCITHIDPRALYGAWAVALAALHARSHPHVDGDAFVAELKHALPADAAELIELVTSAAELARDGRDTRAFSDMIGLHTGVSGFVYHTVPVALHAWLSHPDDYRSAVCGMIACGGDTDTTAAIVGGIVGSRVGTAGIPAEWISGIAEWPRSVRWLEELADALETASNSGTRARPPRLPVAGLVARNVFFLGVVLTHGFRRLLPPY